MRSGYLRQTLLLHNITALQRLDLDEKLFVSLPRSPQAVLLILRECCPCIDWMNFRFFQILGFKTTVSSDLLSLISLVVN